MQCPPFRHGLDSHSFTSARGGRERWSGHVWAEPAHLVPPSLDDAQESEGDGQKKIGATGNSKDSPPKTTCRNEADWERSLPRYEMSPSPPHTCFCHPPVWQSTPVYPDWHKHAAVLFATWQLPPFWHTLLSHGDSAAEEHQEKERQGCQPRRRTSTQHSLHVVIPGLGRAQTGATHAPSVSRQWPCPQS